MCGLSASFSYAFVHAFNAPPKRMGLRKMIPSYERAVCAKQLDVAPEK
jgi:hypothetical protein